MVECRDGRGQRARVNVFDEYSHLFFSQTLPSLLLGCHSESLLYSFSLPSHFLFHPFTNTFSVSRQYYFAYLSIEW